MVYQNTLKKTISCIGIGLHSGKKVTLALKPAPPDTGIVFRRTDLGGKEIRASYEHLANTYYATSLARDGIVLNTIEHILAAFYGLNIDNAYIELDADELPIMDGSAAPFIYLIFEAGIRRQARLRKYVRIKKPIHLSGEKKSISLFPAEELKVSYTIVFDHPAIKKQEETLAISRKTFIEKIAPARTFGFLKDVETLRRNGFIKGGSLDNAIVLGENRILNNELRCRNEFVLHKILDVIGDISLLGYPLLGHIVAYRAGHPLHTQLVSEILEHQACWEFCSRRDPVKASPAPEPLTATSILRKEV
jgi:UDP-3-O-[3-hydroxymyristoyl] N-acetylglucosamine deacetylase